MARVIVILINTHLDFKLFDQYPFAILFWLSLSHVCVLMNVSLINK